LLEERKAYQEVVSNLRVADNSVSVIKLNPPYDLMVDLSKISLGREKHMLLELFNYIAQSPIDSKRVLNGLSAIDWHEKKVFAGLVY
jgi:hypothetical protein